MKTTLPICIFYSIMNSSNYPTLNFFFLFSTLNFINLKPEQSSCKKWCAGHRNACIFRSTFKSISLQLHSSQFQAPLNPKNKRNQLLLSEWTASKGRPTFGQKTKTNSAPWTSRSHLCWVKWRFSLTFILQVQIALLLLIKALSKAKFKPSDSTKYHLLAKLTL